MISSLNGLRIVPREALILHEDHDESRLAALLGRMGEEGVQRNPVIAAPHEDRYLVLDGAHRVHALEKLGCRLALIQVVNLPKVAESWAHLLTAPEFTATLADMAGLEVVERETGGPYAATVQSGGRERLLVGAEAEEGLMAQVAAMWRLREAYPEGVSVRRVEPGGPFELSPEEVVVCYRSFTPAELDEVVGAGMVLPAGITRFHIRERVLGVRFPLEKLADGDAGARDAELRSLVRECREADRIRYYEEPVVLFE